VRGRAELQLLDSTANMLMSARPGSAAVNVTVKKQCIPQGLDDTGLRNARSGNDAAVASMGQFLQLALCGKLLMRCSDMAEYVALVT
jgi:hypothetical protein